MKKTLAILLALVLAVGIFGAVGIIAYAAPSPVIPILEGTKLPESDYEIIKYNELSDAARQAYSKLKDAELISDICGNYTDVLADIDSSAEEENSEIRNIFEFHLFKESESYSRLMGMEEQARYVDLSFKCTVKNGQDLVALEFVDDEWVAVDGSRFTFAEGEGTIKVRSDAIIALVIVTKDKEETQEESAIIVPSVGQKGIPDQAGDFVIRLHVDMEGPQDVVWLIPDDEYEFYECSELLGESFEAYNMLAAAEKISEVCANFNEALAEVDPALSEDNAVVRDVFEFRLGKGSDSMSELLENKDEERRFIDMPFSYSLDAGQYLVVLEFLNDEWVALDQNHCVYDGATASIRIEYDGLLAICVVSK